MKFIGFDQSLSLHSKFSVSIRGELSNFDEPSVDCARELLALISSEILNQKFKVQLCIVDWVDSYVMFYMPFS